MMTNRFMRRGAVVAIALALGALSFSQAAPARADATVQIRDLAFSPLLVTVNQGDAVQWANSEDVMPHNVASGLVGRADAGQLFESPYIMPGDGFSYTFTEPGEYTYFCPLHPTMIGVIMVTPAG